MIKTKIQQIARVKWYCLGIIFISISKANMNLNKLTQIIENNNDNNEMYVVIENYNLLEKEVFEVWIEINSKRIYENILSLKKFKKSIDIKIKKYETIGLIEKKLEILIKNSEYWDNTSERIKTNSCEIINLLQNNVKEKYEFLRYNNKKEYLASTYIIKSLKMYYTDITIVEINLIYKLNKDIIRKLIQSVIFYMDYFVNDIFNNIEEQKLILEITSELYKFGFFDYIDYYKNIKIIENIFMIIKKNDKLDLNVILYLINIIIGDLCRAKDEIVLKKSLEKIKSNINIYVKVNIKVIDFHEHWNMCVKEICNYFDVNELYIIHKGDLTYEYASDNKQIRVEKIKKNNKLKGFIKNLYNLMFIMPKPWKNIKEQSNYSGGKIFGEVFKITSILEQINKINIEDLNKLQKDKYWFDDILIKLLGHVDLLKIDEILKSKQNKDFYREINMFLNVNDINIKTYLLKTKIKSENKEIFDLIMLKKRIEISKFLDGKKLYCLHADGLYKIKEMDNFLKTFILCLNRQQEVNVIEHLKLVKRLCKFVDNAILIGNISIQNDLNNLILKSFDLIKIVTVLTIQNYDVICLNLLYIKLLHDFSNGVKITHISYLIKK